MHTIGISARRSLHRSKGTNILIWNLLASQTAGINDFIKPRSLFFLNLAADYPNFTTCIGCTHAVIGSHILQLLVPPLPSLTEHLHVGAPSQKQHGEQQGMQVARQVTHTGKPSQNSKYHQMFS